MYSTERRSGTPVLIAVLILLAFMVYGLTRTDERKQYQTSLNSVVLIKTTSGLGSGVVVDAKRGLILTNRHVVDDLDIVKVKFRYLKGTHTARVLWQSKNSENHDLALVQLIDAPRLRYEVTIRRAPLTVGEKVYSVGHPLGNEWTVAWGRTAGLDKRGIRLDHTILPGNSGGALFDEQGRFVGVPYLMATWRYGGTGLAWAVPVKVVCLLMRCPA